MIDLDLNDGRTLHTPRVLADGWDLDAQGLEHRGSGYFIDRDTLTTRRSDGLWAWPLQMAEKAWCAPHAFREAFLAALDRFGIEPDEALVRSFAIAQGTRMTGTGHGEEFVRLSELLRPRSADRKRPAPGEPKPAPRTRMEANRHAPASASA